MQLPILLLVAIAAAACAPETITHVRLAKTPAPSPSAPRMQDARSPPQQQAAQPPADLAAAEAPSTETYPDAPPQLQWTLPAGWTAKLETGMRYATLHPGDAGAPRPAAKVDVSVVTLPNMAGAELANVNRWRGQVQLPPLAEADLAQAVSRATHGGLQFTIVELTSPAANNPQAILGAIVLYNGGTWFFKLLGPAPLVARTKPAFLQFLQTVQPVPP
jgi:hypothetical protein